LVSISSPETREILPPEILGKIFVYVARSDVYFHFLPVKVWLLCNITMETVTAAVVMQLSASGAEIMQ